MMAKWTLTGRLAVALALAIVTMAGLAPAPAQAQGVVANVWVEPRVVTAGQPVLVRAQVNEVQSAWLENVAVVNNYAQLWDRPCASRSYTLNVQFRDGSTRQFRAPVTVQGTCAYVPSYYYPPYDPYYQPPYVVRPNPGLAFPLPAPTASVWAQPSTVYAGEQVVVRAQVNNVQAAWLEGTPVVNNYAQIVDYPCGTRTYTLRVQFRDGTWGQQQTTVNVSGGC